jgi:hypothetical protein
MRQSTLRPPAIGKPQPTVFVGKIGRCGLNDGSGNAGLDRAFASFGLQQGVHIYHDAEQLATKSRVLSPRKAVSELFEVIRESIISMLTRFLGISFATY